MAPNDDKLGETQPSTAARLQGKVAIITGCNSLLGIGRAAALQFAEQGAKAIYICDFDDSNLSVHEQEIKSHYPGVYVHIRKFDAADETALQEVISHATKTYGKLDVFFANAGIIGTMTPMMETDAEDFDHVFRVNTLAPFLAAKHAARAMLLTSATKSSPSGSIIITSSVAGLRAHAGPIPYSASKAAVINMAQTMAYELAGTNIRVNAICPGLIETGMTSVVFEGARRRGTEGRIGQLNPLKRGGRAEEVARVAGFLASEESSYVNGQAWVVDGGLSAGHPYVLPRPAKL